TDLACGAVPMALVGVIEEVVWPLPQHRRRLGVDPGQVLAEGSHWWLLGPASSDGSIATLQLQHLSSRDPLDGVLEALPPMLQTGLSRSVDASIGRQTRQYFPQAEICTARPLPFHDSIEAAWLAMRITADPTAEAL